MKTTWRLVVLGVVLCGARYLFAPDLCARLPAEWAPALRLELPLFWFSI
ncbi:hypothetical protein HS125_12145 [bacterium]|nr:hypothetical protein [bacterium]